MRLRRGFTFVEISAVVVVIALMALLAYPYIQSTERSQNSLLFRVELSNKFAQARRLAIEQKVPYEISIQEGTTINLAPRPLTEDEQFSQTNTQTAEPVTETLAIPAEVSVDVFRLNDIDVSESDWRATFFPDGTADPSTAEFTQLGRVYRVVVDDFNGSVTIEPGLLDDRPQEKWQAGEREQRGQ